MGNVSGKRKYEFWSHPETLELVKSNYKKDNCRTQAEFIERAIRYYVGHINAEDDTSYLPSAMLSNMKSIVKESDNRNSRLLFKLSVEMAMMMNILASIQEIDSTTLERLRGNCVKEVMRLNGGFSLENAMQWQRG